MHEGANRAVGETGAATAHPMERPVAPPVAPAPQPEGTKTGKAVAALIGTVAAPA